MAWRPVGVTEAVRPLLEVRNLSVEIPAAGRVFKPVDRVTFSVAPGEILGLVGESGAGKSVTGSAIIGLLQPPGRIGGGEVILSGDRIDNLPPARMRRIRGKRIGLIAQDPLTSLDPLMKVGDQMVEMITTHLPLNAREARDKAIGLLDEVGIPDAARRIGSYPHEFSGGMRQRVVIALALCCDPDLVIADEPTTALDVSVAAQVVALIKRLSRERGMSVILITHDMGVIAETADRVAVLYAGRIAEIGPVRQVVLSPRHPYAKGLMAAIPDVEGTRDRLVQIPGSMPRLSAMPSGCPFHPRCVAAMPVCSSQEPALIDGVACHLFHPAPVAEAGA
jgi:peptide/nickel transport system ATP-binding protein